MDQAALELVIRAKDLASKEIKGLGDTTDDTAKKVQAGMRKTGLAMAAVGAGLTVYAKKATDFTVQLVGDTRKLARETGATEKEASQLLYVTKRMGISADQTSASFGIFSKNIQKASVESKVASGEQAKLRNEIEKVKIEIKKTTDEITKNGDKSGELKNKLDGLKLKLGELNKQVAESGSAFTKIGVSLKDANGKVRPFNDILLQTADRFKEMPDGAKKTSLALELFGRSGKDMIKVLNLGSDGIGDLTARADKLGLTLNSKTIGSVMKYVQAQKDLQDSSDALKIAVGTLTAPVLASFNMKLNEVVQRLISTEGPLRTLTTGVLAFGGPVLSAGGGIAAFAGNLVTAGPAIKGFMGALSGAATFMAGPWGAAIKIAMVAGGLLIASLFSQTSRTNELKRAEENLAATRVALAESQKVTRDANLRLAEAKLGVKRATVDLQNAESTYGKKSLEYREAALRKKRAEYELRDAKDASKKASKDQKVAEDAVSSAAHVAKVVKAQQAKGRSFDNLSGQAANTARKLWEVRDAGNAAAQTKTPTGQKSTKFIDALVGREKGGPVNAGQPYITGEKGKEIFIPKKSGTIIPHKQSMDILKGGSPGGGVQVTNNYNAPMYFTTAEAVKEYFDIRDRNSQLLGNGLSEVRI